MAVTDQSPIVRCSSHVLKFSQSNNTKDKSDVSKHHEAFIFTGYSESGTKRQSWLYTIYWNDVRMINVTVVIILLKKVSRHCRY